MSNLGYIEPLAPVMASTILCMGIELSLGRKQK